MVTNTMYWPYRIRGYAELGPDGDACAQVYAVHLHLIGILTLVAPARFVCLLAGLSG